jgi:hypothetical protein
MLTPREIRFLKIVMERAGSGDPVAAKLPVSPEIQSLIDRGYLRSVRLYDGPFKTPVAEPGLRVTEAGRTAMWDESTSPRQPKR